MTEHECRRFGARRIYYDNFAGHLLNAYNPNMLHPGLPLFEAVRDCGNHNRIDLLLAHVDPRPRHAINKIIRHLAGQDTGGIIHGKWAK